MDATFRTARHLLSAALVEFSPNVQILGGGEESIGFYCDCFFPQGFHSEYLPLIEGGMKKILSERPEIHTFEMVPESAKALLEKMGQTKQAKKLLDLGKVLLCFCQIRSAISLSRGPLLKDWEDLQAFALTNSFSLTDGSTRIFGIASSNRQELQRLQKKLSRYERMNHVTWGKKRQFFSFDEKGWCFYPLGIEVRQKMIGRWRKECAREGFEERMSSQIFPFFSEGKIAQLGRRAEEVVEKEKRFLGLLASSVYHTDFLTVSCSKKQRTEKLISSLQFVRRFSKLFHFEPEWILKKGSGFSLREPLRECGILFREEKEVKGQVEWRARDGLGRPWTLGFLLLKEEYIGISLFSSLERHIALLLEQGQLPFWLEPKQIFLQLLSSESSCKAFALQSLLEKEGYSCVTSGGVKRQSLPEKIPYVIFIGQHGVESNRLIVQTMGLNQKQEMSVNALIQLLRKQIEN